MMVGVGSSSGTGRWESGQGYIKTTKAGTHRGARARLVATNGIRCVRSGRVYLSGILAD